MDTETEPPAASITAGLLSRAQLASDLKCSERTVIRYEHAGMPVIRIRMLRLYNPVSCREWVLSHESRREPVRRGRPTKRAA